MDFLAILFVLLAPYLNYVQHNDFIYEIVNLAIVGGFIAVSAALAMLLRFVRSDLLRVGILAFLLLLFLDIQLYWFASWLWKLGVGALVLGLLSWICRRHLNIIVAAGFGLMVAGTVVQTIWAGVVGSNSTARARETSGNSNLPVYVHIILDEFMGPEGFDTGVASQRAIKSEIKSFFADQGFRLFGRAYSPYYDTYDSVSATLNMVETRETNLLRRTTIRGTTVTQNQYFENIQSRGYDINVYQSDYIDYCTSSPVDIRKCVVYDYSGPTSASLASLGTADKARVVLTMYASLANLGDVAFEAYSALRTASTALGLALPEWAPWPDRLGPISTMPVFDQLIRDVAAAQGGSMFFAHLLTPHHPYSMDSDCRIRRPAMTWRIHYPGYIDMYEANTDESRLARYKRYIPQIRCTLSKVNELLTALKAANLYDDATIVIHGDHGSRLTHFRPTMLSRQRLIPQDYADGFLALYAVKSPEISPGYDQRPVSLPQLIRALIQGDMDIPAGPGGGQQPQVFLRQSNNVSELVQVPVPCVEDGRQGEEGSLAVGLCTAGTN
ncbi:MAG: hypothetical protein ACTSW2_05740 [Alphaproteobacteria bacterium]